MERNDCPHCKGTGYVKTNETMGIEVMRLLQLAGHRTPAITAATLIVHAEVAFYILNRKRRLTMRMAWALHRQWGIPAEALIRPPIRRRGASRAAAE